MPSYADNDYVYGSRAAVAMAKRHNRPLATQLIMDCYDIYLAEVNNTAWAMWNLAALPPHRPRHGEDAAW
jgi:hypothetical protein